MEKSNKINSSKELIENISNKINNRNYRSYSVSNNDVPLNFVPTIKPKYIIFEEKDPFFLQSSDIENDQSETNSTFSIHDNQHEINYIKRNKSNSFDNHLYYQKRKLSTILSKLIEKNQLKNKERLVYS